MMQILEDYEINLVQVKQASENTVASYMRDLNQFSAYLQESNIALEDVERQTILDYMAHLQEKGKSSSTISRSVASLKSFFQFLMARGNGTPIL